MTESPGPVVTVGEALVALSAASGRLEDAAALDVHAVGAELNYAVDLSRLGIRSRWFGAVGDDPMGRLVVRRMRAEGVDARGVTVDRERPTAILFKDLAGMDGERPVHYMRRGSAGAAFAPTPTLRAAAEEAAGVHVTGISFVLGEGLGSAAEALLDAGAGARWRSFDLNVRLRLAAPEVWRRVLDQALGRVNVLFATISELASVGLDPGDVLSRCRDLEVTAVLRHDHSRTEVTEPDGTQTPVVSANEVAAVDPVGSGDAFAAAVTAFRLEGADWAAAVRAGQAAGAMVVRTWGDYEGAPYRAELVDYIQGREIRR